MSCPGVEATLRTGRCVSDVQYVTLLGLKHADVDLDALTRQRMRLHAETYAEVEHFTLAGDPAIEWELVRRPMPGEVSDLGDAYIACGDDEEAVAEARRYRLAWRIGNSEETLVDTPDGPKVRT